MRRAAMPVLLFVITAGFFWKLTLTSQFTWLNQPDLVNEIMPAYQFEAREWHAGRFPLWDPYTHGGQPILGLLQPGGAYPLNWVLFSLPLNHGRISRIALNWYFVLIHYMGALFCYWLCRDLKRSQAASLLAGAAFGLGGCMGTVDWPQMLNGAVWAPLVFLFFLRAMRGENPVRNAALAGTFLGVSLLSGHHQVPTFVALAVAGAWLYFAFSQRRPRLVAAVVFMLQTFLVGALQILPGYEYGKLAVRPVNSTNPVFWSQMVPYTVHWFYSLFPVSVMGIVIPGIWRNANPYVGLVVAALACAAVYGAWKEKPVRFFGALLIAALFFALGGYTVFHGVLYSLVPMVNKARTPAMAILIFDLALTVLAAYGLDACREAGALHDAWTGRIMRCLVAMSVVIYATVFVSTRFRAEQSLEYDDPAAAALSGLVLALLLYAWRKQSITNNTAITLAFLLMLFELGTVTGANFYHRETPGGDLHTLDENADIVGFLKGQTQPLRIEAHEEQHPLNFGQWHGIEQFRSMGSVAVNVVQVQDEPQAVPLFALGYYVGTKPVRDSQVEVFRGASGLNVYRNPEAFPRVWTVHEVREIHGKSEVLPALQDDLRRRTFLMGAAPSLETCADADAARVLSHEPNHMVIEADMGCKGMAILADAFFPGWEATVDGRDSRIYEAYTMLRGVVVDAGQHRIEMRYRPMSVYLGAALTLVGLLSAALFAFALRDDNSSDAAGPI